MKITTGQLLSLGTRKLCCDIGLVYEALNFLTGDDIYTHVIPRALTGLAGLTGSNSLFNMTKYLWGINDGDVLFGPCDTVDEAEKDAREYYDTLEEDTEIVVWDSRPATQADAELFEGYDDLNDEEIDTTKPGWERGRLVPETEVKRFTISGPQPSSSNDQGVGRRDGGSHENAPPKS